MSTRELFLSTRPWSFPASAVPAILAVGCVGDRVRHPMDAFAPALGVLLLHIFGNVVNTYFDFFRGIDTVATADDRALVDKKVNPRQLVAIAAVSLVSGAGIIAYYASALGPHVGYLGLAGTALAFFYTADPLSLKYLGLGDLVIFLDFGPLLMLGVSFCATRSLVVDPAVLATSVPIGALTVAILHANNARDIESDRAGGARTLAMALGLRGSFLFYIGLLVTAYASSSFALLLVASRSVGVDPLVALTSSGSLFENPPHLSVGSLLPPSIVLQAGTPPAIAAITSSVCGIALLLVLTLPHAVRLTRQFGRGELALLPQSTAQFNLVFGAVLLTGMLLRAHVLTRVAQALQS